MGCGIAMVKYLLFLFNFVFVLLGVAILTVGIYISVSVGDYTKLSDIVSSPAISFIVIGAIVFIIAFFGCCGAIRESHCMVITYAVFLLTILIIQVAVGIWAFVLGNEFETTSTKTEITTAYQEIFAKYWTDNTDQVFVDTVQSSLSCCGITGASDFNQFANTTIPWSCCGTDESTSCSTSTAFSTGCVTKILEFFNKVFTVIGGVAVGVAATELIGIIFALCLANSIRNDDRRGYRV